MCGLFAYVSKDNEWTELRRWKFQMLGVANDDRGGDGCGIAFDGIVIKGATPKKFDEFWRLDNVPYELEMPAIIGHDRKASVGAQTLENTQPICFDNMNTILAHNGTVYNYKEMHASHKVKDHFDNDIVGMSDSQVMCMLIEKSGWQILNEYEGSMAFLLMRADEPGVIYAYHGKSRYRRSATVDTEERPLFYATEKGDTWLCSTKIPLEKIIVNKDSILELPFNKVFRFDGETMTEVFSVNRENCVQWEDYIPAKPTTYPKRYDNDYFYNKKDEEDSRQPALPFQGTKKKISEDKYWGQTKGCIYYEQGYFKMDGEKLDGLVSITSHGRVTTYSDPESMSLYFHEGNLVKGEDAYIDLIHTLTTEEYAKSFSQRKLWMIGKFFANPFVVSLDSKGGSEDILYSAKVLAHDSLCSIRYTGQIHIPFTAKVLVVRDGELTDTIYKQYAGTELFKEFQVLDPVETAKTLVERFEELKTEEEPEKKYTCPFCLGYGSTFTNDTLEMECEPCNGTGYLTLEAIKSYVNLTSYGENEISNIFVSHEVEKARSIVIHAIDRVIDALDQVGYQDAIDLSDKLNDIKLSLWEKL